MAVAGTAGAIATTDDLRAVAAGLEADAAGRYRGLAAWWDAEGERDLAALFTSLAAMEETHAAALGRPDLQGHLLPAEDDAAWRSAMLTPYRALSLAVRAEERAFAFYADVAAHAPTPAVRALAETLARDELDHAAQLRRARRTAFRAERVAPSPPLADMADLERQSAAWEAEEAAATTRSGRLRAVSRNIERYLEAAERTRNEAVLLAAQQRAAAALRRLTAMRAGSGGP